jgi:hypothetical protein
MLIDGCSDWRMDNRITSCQWMEYILRLPYHFRLIHCALDFLQLSEDKDIAISNSIYTKSGFIHVIEYLISMKLKLIQHDHPCIDFYWRRWRSQCKEVTMVWFQWITQFIWSDYLFFHVSSQVSSHSDVFHILSAHSAYHHWSLLSKTREWLINWLQWILLWCALNVDSLNDCL